MTGRLPIEPTASAAEAVTAVREWIEATVPATWREAAHRGGHVEIRTVRSHTDYEAWYPAFGASGLVVANWPVAYGGLGVSNGVARAIDAELRPYNLGRLNPLGLNNAAAALFAHGSEEQRQRFLPPIVRNEERWCQLFSEPGAGSDLFSLGTRAVRDGDEWIVNGQKVWTTWGFDAEFAVLLARTNPDAPKRQGLTYFLIDMRQPGVDVRNLRHIGGGVDFCEVFLDDARVPDAWRVGGVDDGWRVSGSTLSSERQMVAGGGSGGVDRIGGGGITAALRLARSTGGFDEPVTRDRLMHLYAENRVREWTNLRIRANLKAGRAPGPESSIGKVHQGALNQRLQLAASDLLGMGSVAWESAETDYAASLPYQVAGMFRSRANTIEGGTTEINKNVIGERALGLPREPDPWHDAPWSAVPRS